MNEKENIYLFVPNIIGYGRVILAIVSFYYMPTNHVIAVWCYFLSSFLDAFDGHAARYFNQSTKFGAMLDQITDRCGTMCLCATLCYLYPKFMFLFQMSMVLDISSHWIHLQTELMRGKTSHKLVDLSENPVMRIYYTSRVVLFTMCAGNEIFYLTTYLVYFTSGPIIPLLGVGLFKLLVVVSAPIALVKSLISVLQLVVACQNLVGIDAADREKKD
ncbi:CDIPT (predicted) [Pycnogonum litorale]